jgi:single-stranded-DNA-specific exonuclease
MNQENSRRQDMEQMMIKEIDELLQTRQDIHQRKSLVLWSETWHRGILGLVASKLVERLSRPVFLFTIEGEKAHGSGRSIEGFHLFNGLETLEEYLLGFGGHAAAAGASLMVKDLPAFEQAMENLVQESVDERSFIPSLNIEGEIDFPGLTKEIAPYLLRLAPFGSKNPEPLLITRQVRVKANRQVGNGHLRLKLKQKRTLMDGIGFGLGKTRLQTNDLVDLAYVPFISEYGSTPRLELRIKDIKLSTSTTC